MPLAPSDSEPVLPRRRTVRILRQRRLSREAAISLWLAGGAAVVVLGFWWFSATAEEVARPRVPTLADAELTWRCEVGHTFLANGQPGGRVCLYCERMAYPVTEFRCPVHGPFQVTVRFADTADGSPRIAYLRLTGRDWVSVETGLHCPRCDRPLEHRPKDPLDVPTTPSFP
jgi:hypothetical protein